MSVMIVAMLTLTNTTLRGNRRLAARASALSAAESGAAEGVLWLRDQTAPPLTDQDITSRLAVPAPAGVTWTVTVTNDVNNATQFLKIYLINSTATVRGQKRQVRVVVRQGTFGKYAYFTDKETSTSGGAIWWNSSDSIDGPVHSNNTGPTPNTWTNFQIDYSAWNTYKRAIFQDMVESCAPTINFTPSKPTTDSTFQRVFLNGSKGYLLGVTKVNLPASTAAQQQAAWGGTSGFPSTTTGVYLRPDANSGNGGIYIRGDQVSRCLSTAAGTKS